MQVQDMMQVQFYGMFYKKKKEKGKLKKEGHKYRVSSMVEMKPLVESRIPFFWFLCAWRKQKALSFLDYGTS